MPANHLETSVFIQSHQAAQTRASVASVSGRPLLTSSTSTMSKTSTHSQCCIPKWRFSKKASIPFLLAFLVSAIIVIILIGIMLSQTTHHSRDESFCREAQKEHIDSYSSHHQKCGSKLKLKNECAHGHGPIWRYFDKASSTGWRAAQRLFSGKPEKNASAMIVSPRYNVSSQSCSIQISINIPTQFAMKVFVVSPSINDTYVTMTSGFCRHGVIDDRELFSQISPFRIIILLQSPMLQKDISASVSSHKCFQYKTIENEPRLVSNRSFAIVPRGTGSLCSLETINGKRIECDWLDVIGIGNSHFLWTEIHRCVFRGVSNEKDDFNNFLSLEGKQPHTTAYIISPVVEGGASHLLLSFWYIAQCNRTKARVYLVPSSHDVEGVLRDIHAVREIEEEKTSFKWKLEVIEIPIPVEFKSFQIVIEGVVTRDGSCEEHRCHIEKGRTTPDAPLLAVDDIAFELKNDICNISDPSMVENMNCSFQAGDNSTTVCSWISSIKKTHIPPEFLNDEWRKFNSHWKPENIIKNTETDHGALSSHLKDRGAILTFSANGMTNSRAYLRSPTLVGNSNCSCEMEFLYLLRGKFAPRLQVNLVYSKQGGTLRREPQWSVFGHQSNTWMRSYVPLNLQTKKPFQVEVQVRDVRDTKGDAHIDDILFRNCEKFTNTTIATLPSVITTSFVTSALVVKILVVVVVTLVLHKRLIVES